MSSCVKSGVITGEGAERGIYTLFKARERVRERVRERERERERERVREREIERVRDREREKEGKRNRDQSFSDLSLELSIFHWAKRI